MLGTFLTLLTIILAVLKLAGVLTISWTLVLLPVILGVVMFILAFIAFAIISVIA